jgi:predicted permease
MILRTVFESVFPIFALIAVGYCLARVRDIDLGPFTDMVIYLTAPCLVLSSFLHHPIPVRDFGQVFLAALGIVAITGLAFGTGLRAAGKLEAFRGLLLPVMFMNTGNMGLALNQLAFGPEGLSYAVIFFVSVATLHYSLGIAMLKVRSGFREVLRLPLIYAAVLGVGLNLGRVSLPTWIVTPIDLIGQIAIPLMILILGYQLRHVHFQGVGLSAMCAILRIGGGFLTGLVMVKILGLSGTAAKVVILMSSLPPAVLNSVLAKKFDRNPELVSSTILIGTLISILTTPTILYWLLGQG